MNTNGFNDVQESNNHKKFKIPSMKEFLGMNSEQRKEIFSGVEVTKGIIKEEQERSGFSDVKALAGRGIGDVFKSSDMGMFGVGGFLTAGLLGTVAAPTVTALAATAALGGLALGATVYGLETIRRTSNKEYLQDLKQGYQEIVDKRLEAKGISMDAQEQIEKSSAKIAMMKMLGMAIDNPLAKGIGKILDMVGDLGKTLANSDSIDNKLSSPSRDTNYSGPSPSSGMDNLPKDTLNSDTRDRLDKAIEVIANNRNVPLTKVPEKDIKASTPMEPGESFGALTYLGTIKDEHGDKQAVFKTKSNITLTVPSKNFDIESSDRKEKGKSYTVALDNDGKATMTRSVERNKDVSRQQSKGLGD